MVYATIWPRAETPCLESLRGCPPPPGYLRREFPTSAGGGPPTIFLPPLGTSAENCVPPPGDLRRGFCTSAGGASAGIFCNSTERFSGFRPWVRRLDVRRTSAGVPPPGGPPPGGTPPGGPPPRYFVTPPSASLVFGLVCAVWASAGRPPGYLRRGGLRGDRLKSSLATLARSFRRSTSDKPRIALRSPLTMVSATIAAVG
jgi:hypothetical protein